MKLLPQILKTSSAFFCSTNSSCHYWLFLLIQLLDFTSAPIWKETQAVITMWNHESGLAITRELNKLLGAYCLINNFWTTVCPTATHTWLHLPVSVGGQTNKNGRPHSRAVMMWLCLRKFKRSRMKDLVGSVYTIWQKQTLIFLNFYIYITTPLVLLQWSPPCLNRHVSYSSPKRTNQTLSLDEA